MKGLIFLFLLSLSTIAFTENWEGRKFAFYQITGPSNMSHGYIDFTSKNEVDVTIGDNYTDENTNTYDYYYSEEFNILTIGNTSYSVSKEDEGWQFTEMVDFPQEIRFLIYEVQK